MFQQILRVLLLSLAFASAEAGEAGRVVFVSGQVQVSGRSVDLGGVVKEGDDLVTGADGYLYLKMLDGGFLVLRPASRARIAAYRLAGAGADATQIKFELQQGVARAISGDAVKQARQGFRFNTPVAAIGVRGTDFTVFTDAHVTRVSVLSGGVVVSGFSSTCGPEGFGPCEGGGSRDLFAEQSGQLLQVRRGQVVPQLLRAAELSPDALAPPRKDEPAGKAPGEGGRAGDSSLDAHRVQEVLAGGLLPLAKPVPVVPLPPEVVWGRWEAVAGAPADAELLAKLRSGAYELPRAVGSMVVARLKDGPLVLPGEGRAAFRLVGSEAYIRADGQAPVAAAVRDSSLEIDFAARSFATGLSIEGGGTQVNVRARGDITRQGELVSSLLGSNATVRGYLAGNGAREAGYVFQTYGSPGLPAAFGGVQWAR